MRPIANPPIHPVVIKIQKLIGKIDRLRLPPASRCDVESILVRQVSEEIDRALPWQAGHGQRAADVAIRIGQATAMTAVELHHLKLAAFLHDIGLLMLPHELTSGPYPFDSESYVAVQSHSRLGAQLLEPFPFLREAAVLIAHHHERWDGSGYPYGVRGSFIPLGARILAIADTFDSIAVPGRPCPEIRQRVALRILKVVSGTQLDPRLVRLTHRVFGQSTLFPWSTQSEGEWTTTEDLPHRSQGGDTLPGIEQRVQPHQIDIHEVSP